ncbi:MAG: hypothetical protein SGILL_003488, partial [Bacillariaceae sp.]
MTTSFPQQLFDPSIDDLLKISDPPLDHVVVDEDEESLPGRTSPTRQKPANGNTFIIRPVPPSPPRKDSLRSSGPVDLDDTVIDDSTDEETQDTSFDEEAPSSSDTDDNYTDTDRGNDTDTALNPHPIDLDSLQDREEDFSMIFREHEDEFLVWKGNEKLQSMAFKNAQNNKFVESTEGNNEDTIVFYESSEQEVDDCQSIDTYGFSVAASVDSCGFSVAKESKPKPRRSEQPKANSALSKTETSTEESRARTIQHIKEVLKKDQEEKEETDNNTVEGLGAKARGLRALRLRSANYKLNQKMMNTVHEDEELKSPDSPKRTNSKLAPMKPPSLPKKPEAHEETPSEEQKESSGPIEYPGKYGLEIQQDNTAQSVLSEITTLSDKLFVRIKSETESKWDDVSSVGLTGVEGRPEPTAPAPPQDNFLYSEEAKGWNVEDPPFAFDASVKTPPFPLDTCRVEKSEPES